MIQTVYIGSRPLAATTAADMLTAFPLTGSGKIAGFRAVVKAVTTDVDGAATINLEIGSTNLSGGVLTLGFATFTPIGKVVEATAITGNNTFVNGDTLSIECSAITAWNDGEVELFIDIVRT